MNEGTAPRVNKVAFTSISAELRTYDEAMRNLIGEIRALEDNKVWSVIKRAATVTLPLSKWVLKTKT